jgi:hypothetical protein
MRNPYRRFCRALCSKSRGDVNWVVRGVGTERPNEHDKPLTDYMLGAWRDHGRLDANRVGAFGFSAGGLTVLVAAGGEPDFRTLPDHCKAHPAFEDCPDAAGYRYRLDPRPADQGGGLRARPRPCLRQLVFGQSFLFARLARWAKLRIQSDLEFGERPHHG